ncbi:SPAS2 protein, partial [Climacteris rufus]|nr:SPAS2 protein [Climacteris rufus]
PTDASGFIFDVQSNTVMAQGGSFENMKEKIGAVRAIVPNRSNNEIVLVLQHFDNCVDRTVQAFMEGNASEVLKEWTVTGKKKNKKKKSKPKVQPGSSPAGKSLPKEEGSWEKGALNGFHVNGCGPDSESVDSLSEGLDAPSVEECEASAPGAGKSWMKRGERGKSPKLLKSEHSLKKPGKARERPSGKLWDCSVDRSQGLEPRRDAPAGSSIEKSLKDLQRCSVSLARFRALLREELEASVRRVRRVCAELQGSLMDREVALLAEMDKVKAEAMEILAFRQRRAEALRKLTEAAPGMSEEQLLELRADIKHFVSERKFDEELGRAGRFSCDLGALRGSIAAFGQVSHPKPSYSSRSRCSPGTTPVIPAIPGSPCAPSSPGSA